MTLQEIISLEPRVGELLAEASSRKGEGWRCYEHFKRQLSRYVGRGAGSSVLASVDAYETVLRTLVDAMEV